MRVEIVKIDEKFWKSWKYKKDFYLNSFNWWRYEKITTFENWLFRTESILKGTTRSTRTNRYKAKDGFYYNGFSSSTDACEG